MPSPETPDHWDAFEGIGEAKVRAEYLHHGNEVSRSAVAWLAEKQRLREEAEAAKRDVREERMLALTSEANRIAVRASRWAMYAAIIATAAIAYTVKDSILALIFGHP